SVLIDKEATILKPIDADVETDRRPHGEAGLTRRIGSTGKGVGAARIRRILKENHPQEILFGPASGTYIDIAIPAPHVLRAGGTVMIEGVQGYGLGLHAGYYPYCTTIDCRAIDMLALAGISPWYTLDDGPDGQVLSHHLEVWIVYRAFPIRVAG